MRHDRYPLGERGDLPAVLRALDARALARQFPGAMSRGRELRCTWDLAPVIAAAAGIDAPIPPAITIDGESCPGIARFRAEVLPRLRRYQVEACAFLAARSYALCCDEMRLGKTIEAIAASTLIDARRTLIVPPASVRLQWADETKTWTGETALLLYGRAGNEARWHGERRKLSPGAIAGALEHARYVVCNSDLLIPQTRSDATGRVFTDPDLRGWAPVLSAHRFDLAIIDEIHRMRGWRKSIAAGAAPSKAEVLARVLDPIRVVWGLTGTPIMAHVRDLWLQLQLVAKCWGETPFAFHTRYCGGGHRTVDTSAAGDGSSMIRSWYDAGESNLDELQSRLAWIRIQRSQRDVFAELPPKTRQVIRIEHDGATVPGTGDARSKLYRMLARSAPVKIDACVERAQEELEQGAKVIVFAKQTETADRCVAAWRKQIAKSSAGAALRARDCAIWHVTGETTAKAETRYELANAFRAHTGAALWIGTIDACLEGLNLAGAGSMHFLEVAHEPYKVRQAEMRAFLPGATRGLAIYFYSAGEADETWLGRLVPRLDALDQIAGDSDGAALADALRASDEIISAEAIMESLTAHLEGD